MHGCRLIFKVPLAAGIALIGSMSAAETLPMFEAAYQAGRIRIRAEFRSAQDACRLDASRTPDAPCLQAARAGRRAALSRLKVEIDAPAGR